ncbi:MAG: branched chain amino acid aminotransferase [Phototrophicales bacterium]|nr:MAG: branched chain amino acid aminotransferase [Phototrophicales bacterium]RMG75984.1 MAG: branched-chain amino acid transaminase [Chloroflexota bacterium]
MANPKYAFFKGKIVPMAEAKISVMTHALNYGTGVFGGLRGYWNDKQEQLYIFRPIDHFKRLLQSARMMRIELPYSADDLTRLLVDLLNAEGYRENCYIRPLAYKSSEMIGVKLHGVDDDFTMFALPFGRYVQNEEGAHVCFSAWRRIDDNAIPARGKIVGAYANSSLIKSDALLSGYDEAIVLNEDGHISEMSAANIFLIRDGVAITPPVNSNILEGITRRSIIQLLKEDLGIDVVERDIDRTEIYIADEAFMCGTGVQIAAITKVEHRNIGDGTMGAITSRLRDYFFKVVSGQIEKYHSWLTPVYEEVPAK